MAAGSLYFNEWRFLSRAQVGHSLQRADERLFAMLRAHLNSLGQNKFELRHADKAEDAAQVGFQMFKRGRRRPRAVKPAARDRHDDALVAGQSLRSLCVVFEGLAGYDDAVDPGLELAR